MNFRDVLVSKKITNKNETVTVSSNITEAKKEDPGKLLRKAGLKIKLTAGTAFGTQYTMAKKYDEDEIKDVLKGFNIKIKGNDIFVVE